MALKFFVFFFSFIIYVYCIGFNFTNIPEKIIPGEPLNIEFKLDNANRTEYTVNFHLCQLNNCSKAGSMKILNETNYFNGTTLFNNDICYFYGKPINDWQIRAEVVNNDNEEYFFDTKKINRELICEDAPCIEEACTTDNPNALPTEEGTPVTGREAPIIPSSIKPFNINDEPKKDYTLLLIILISLTLIIVSISIGTWIYFKKFKKKEEDPIPIFSVEESSYCCEPPGYTPPLVNVSYHSNNADKSLLSLSKNSNISQQKTTYSYSPKNMNLSVQLQPISPVNDYYSHSSQNSNRSRVTNTSFKIKQDNNNNNEVKSISSKQSNSPSPNFSPISLSTSIPNVSMQKIDKKKPVKNDSNDNKNNRDYNSPPSPNVYTESAVVNEVRSKISDKHSYHANPSNDEKESTKVLSSKHYVLSTFEGDYDKEELNLHYGDIVSVINILPDGWAYGELLMNYKAYGSNSNNDKVKRNSKVKQRKFGYYPIKCLSPNEDGEAEEVIPESTNKEKDISRQELKPIDLPTDDSNSYNYNYEKEKSPLPKSPQKEDNHTKDNNNENHKESIVHNKSNDNNKNSNDNNKNNDNHKENDNKTININNNDNDKNDENNKRKILLMHSRSTSNTVNTRNSKRSSFLNIFKRASKDFSISSKEAVFIFSEPNSYHRKQNSRESVFNESNSIAETIYHDAQGEEAEAEVEVTNTTTHNKKYINRTSMRSSLSYRSY